MSDAPAISIQRPTRNVFLRILFGFLWYVLFYNLTYMLIGGVVGTQAGIHNGSNAASTIKTYDAGFAAGRDAGMDFFRKYDPIIIMGQILVFAVLCYFRLLPGVGKYKKLKQ